MSGLPFNTIEFGALPPHFSETVLQTIDWETILPGYDNYPDCFRQTFPFLLASIVKHQNWLRENLPLNHPLFLAYVFTSGLTRRLEDNVLVGNLCCPTSRLMASGVPHSVMVSKYLGDLQQKVNEIEGNLNTKYAEEAQSIRNLIGEKNNDCNHQINEFRLHS